MKQNSTRSLKATAIAVMLICAVNAVHVTIQGVSIISYPEGFGVSWFSEAKWLQITMLVGRIIGGLGFSVLISFFIIKSIRALKNGTIFPKGNIPLLYSSAGSLFLYRFCYTNMAMAVGADRNICIDTDDIVMPLLLVMFAMLYTIAVRVSDENRLTI